MSTDSSRVVFLRYVEIRPELPGIDVQPARRHYPTKVGTLNTRSHITANIEEAAVIFDDARSEY